MIIAFSGADGVGKTSLINGVKSNLYKNAVVIGEFDTPLLRIAKRFTNRANKKYKENKILKKERKKTFFFSMADLLFPTIIFLDYLYLHIRYEIFTDNIVVLKDRHIFDFVVTMRSMEIYGKYAQFILSIVPKPTITFYINSDIKDVAKRINDNRDFSFGNEYYNKLKLDYDFIMSDTNTILIRNKDFETAQSLIINTLQLRHKLSKLRTIAISGLDGAGKSTTLNNLQKLLRELGIRYHFIHFYYNYIPIKILRSLVLNKTKIETAVAHEKSVAHEKKARLQKKPWYWKWYVITDAYIQYYYVKIRHHNKLILFDRFFPDYLVSFKFLGVKHDKDKLLSMFPKPDRYFLQIADYKILHKRKPEHTLKFFEECHRFYLELNINGNMITLDSGKLDEKQIIDVLVLKL